MQYIKHNDLLVALIINKKDFPEGMEFWGPSEVPLQFGSCMYNKGKILQSHTHKVRERIPEHKTIEFLYVIQGSIKTTFYSLDKIPIVTKVLREGDCVMLYDGGHGFEILEDGTTFIEVKNGPYISIEADKEKF